MDMIVEHLSGSSRRAQHCQKRLLRSYQLPGDRGRRNVTMGTSNGLLTFVDFCHKRQADPLCAITKTGIEFLNEYFNTGVGYSAVNSARSALSSLIKPLHGIPFGKDPLVSRFLRGVFNIRPALPRYVTTWNVSKVFQYLKKQQALVNCDLKAVSHRLAILLSYNRAT